MARSASMFKKMWGKGPYGPSSHKPSLSKDYFAFAAIITFVVMVLAVGLSAAVYVSQLEHKKNRLKSDISLIERVFLSRLDYIQGIATILGRKIVQHGDSDLEYISHIFRQTTLPDTDPNNVFSWSLFDWVNHNNLQVINTRLGVVNRPKDMSMRSYTRKCRAAPWKLQMSKPAIGYPSGQWVIPVALGVTDNNNTYLGAVSTGVNIGKLTQKIEQSLKGEISFAIIGEDEGNDTEVVLVSDGMPTLENKSEMVKQFLKAKGKAAGNGIFHAPLVFGDNIFPMYKKMQQYPYYILVGYRKDAEMQEFLSIFLPRILEFTAVGMFFFVLLMFFRHKIIMPITRLSDAADRISHGELDVVIPRSSCYEMDNLGRQLEHVVRYIGELQHIRSELIKKTEAAEGANKAKSEFLACMSHELRTPLNAVIAFSEILKEEMFGALGNEKYQEYAFDIYNSGTHLLSIINDILDISKAEAGMIILQKHQVDVRRVVQECIDIVSDRAINGRVALEMDVDSSLPYLVSDELRLKQIIINLLSNAIKFTNEGGKVTVSANATIKGNLVTDYFITIHDTGIGMKEADIPKAIEKFGQLDSGLNRKFEGAGLGLPLTKKLVEIHQGNLSIESELGVGTKVTIHFPQSDVVQADGVVNA